MKHSWICPHAPEQASSRAANLGNVWGKLEIGQPYVEHCSALPSGLARTNHLLRAFLPPERWLSSFQHIDRMIADLVAAQLRQPCVHAPPHFLYCTGDSPLFFPCEARQALGNEIAERFFEQALTELASIRLESVAILRLHPSTG